MRDFAQRLKAYIETHPFNDGDSNNETVLDQLYQAYAESRESDPPEIQAGFAELESFLENLPLDDNNAIFSSAAVFASITNAKPSSTVCSMGHT